MLNGCTEVITIALAFTLARLALLLRVLFIVECVDALCLFSNLLGHEHLFQADHHEHEDTNEDKAANNFHSSVKLGWVVFRNRLRDWVGLRSWSRRGCSAINCQLVKWNWGHLWVADALGE